MTRLKLRKDDPIRNMMATMRGLPCPSKVADNFVIQYGDFYESIIFDVLYRRQPKFKRDFVFHYTSLEVFDKLIAPDGDLLMTRFNELNDYTELTLGWQYVMKRLKWSGYITGLKARFFESEKKRMIENSRIPYIMSFSEAGDDLSQWRGYTDRESGGCSIAFDFREINYTVYSVRKKEGGLFDFYFLPCLYEDEGTARVWNIWRDIRKSKLEEIRSLSYKELKPLKEWLIRPLVEELLVLSAIIKHHGFCSEREWRLMVVPKSREQVEAIPEPILLNGKHRYGLNMCFGLKKPLYSEKWIRGVGTSPHPKTSLPDRFWKSFDDFCKAGRKQWETGAWMSEIPYRGK